MYGVQFQCKLFQQWIKISLTASLIGSSVKMDTTMTMEEIRKMISGEHRKTSVQIEEPTWNLDDWDDGEEEDNSKVLLWFVLMWFIVISVTQFPSPSARVPGVPCLVTITHHKPGSVVTNLVLTVATAQLGGTMQCKCWVLTSWWLHKSIIFNIHHA